MLFSFETYVLFFLGEAFYFLILFHGITFLP